MTGSIISVRADMGCDHGQIFIGDLVFPCALGRAGLIAAESAAEGDRATPMGRYRLTEGFWRADKLQRPACALPLTAIDHKTGWCDDPQSPYYNQCITRPFSDSHERLWRDDNRYDLLFVLSFNRDPIIPGKGSAIFLHMTDDRLSNTLGCIALRPGDLIALAARMGQDQDIDIAANPVI